MKKTRALDPKLSQALVEALKPLADLCIALSISSPELERLARVAMVTKAFERLPKHPRTGSPPTENQVAIATGLSRDMVAKINRVLKDPKERAKKPEHSTRPPNPIQRIIDGWTSDPKYSTSAGHPLDLPIKPMGGHRSFQELVREYAGSLHRGSALKELTRRGNVEVLEDEVVRFKRRSPRAASLSTSSIAETSDRLKRFGETVFENVVNDAPPVSYDESVLFELTPAQLALMRPRIERHIKAFLKGVEGELRGQVGKDEGETVTVGIAGYSWKE